MAGVRTLEYAVDVTGSAMIEVELIGSAREGNPISALGHQATSQVQPTAIRSGLVAALNKGCGLLADALAHSFK